MPNRSKAIVPSKAESMFKKHYSDALNNIRKGHYIFRGIPHTSKPLVYVRPSQTERTSKNTDNVYTALIDILPSWRGWPKRSRSIVCSSSIEYTKSYTGPSIKYGSQSPGATYCVFPKNGAKIGVCSDEDIWSSFPMIFKRWNTGNMNEFNRQFSEVLNAAMHMATGEYHEKEIGELNGEEMLEFLNRIEHDITEESFIKYRNNTKYRQASDEIVEDILHDKFEAGISWINYFDELMNPEANQFHLTDTAHYIEDQYNTREAWTDSDCLLIRMSYFNRDGNRVGNDFRYVHDFIKKVTGEDMVFV